MNRPRAAVIGAGVSGLTAAYLLQRRYDVTLFEAEPRLGGHAHTHDVLTADAGVLPVDTGFIVHNRVTYPHLLRLFAELGVATQRTQMSMSIRCEGCGLQYAGGRGPSGLLAGAASAPRRPYARMLAEVVRFHRAARRELAAGDDTVTLGDFVAAGGFSAYFTAHFLLPVVAAVWSAAPGVALAYPARYLFTFLANHGMLSVRGSHPWWTVVGGSRSYVERAAKQLSAVELATPVRAVARQADGVDVRTEDGDSHHFDAAVLATPADTALHLLAEPTPAERRTLGAFRYSTNDTVLHRDASLLPTARGARASWNYLLPGCDARPERVLVSYDLNRLQRLGTREEHVATLNATDRVDARSVLARMRYRHPIYTLRSVAAQAELPALSGPRLAFAGAYHGWGFHEDGCRSGVAAAAALGVAW